MLHFSFDYLSAPLLVFEDSLSLLLLAAIGILLWLAVGFVFLLYFTIRIAEFVTKKTYFDPKEAVEERWPRPLGFGMVHFVCPACGYTGARVLNGRLQCLGCGRLFQ